MLEFSRLFSASIRTWLVLALCLLVVGALAALFVLDVPVSRLLLVLLVLACPLSHLLLGHGGHGHGGHGHGGHDPAEHQHPAGAPQHTPANPASPAIQSRGSESSVKFDSSLRSRT